MQARLRFVNSRQPDCPTQARPPTGRAVDEQVTRLDLSDLEVCVGTAVVGDDIANPQFLKLTVDETQATVLPGDEPHAPQAWP